MSHPHFSSELTRAHRDDLQRNAQAHRLARAARRRTTAGADPVRLPRWVLVLRRLRRPSLPVPVRENP